jgi:hypothetical protein
MVASLELFVVEAVEARGGDTSAVKPSHRVKFQWPPHPISYEYHVLTSDWKGKSILRTNGEEFPVAVATTPYGVFGRCEALWLEARGDTEDLMLQKLAQAAQPLLTRQVAIADSLGKKGRFTDHIRDLEPTELVQLLYCKDRDVANDARIEIETHASSSVFFPGLIFVLRDRKHPYRRSAQWCVLDLFEDLPSFAKTELQQEEALLAMKGLIWDAEDDYARTIYKAGVVLGGHIPDTAGGRVLLECLEAPSKYGRRSAIHGLYHVVEWIPSTKDEVVGALRAHAAKEEDPELREFAILMARDIEAGDVDHVPEPVFVEER